MIHLRVGLAVLHRLASNSRAAELILLHRPLAQLGQEQHTAPSTKDDMTDKTQQKEKDSLGR